MPYSIKRVGLFICILLLCLQTQLAFSNGTEESSDCKKIISGLTVNQPIPGTYAYYLTQARVRSSTSGAQPPRFKHPLDDISRSQTWKGVPRENLPQVIQDLLPPEATLIDHELPFNAEPGLVKGSFPHQVSLRVNPPKNMGMEGTNVGVSIHYLLHNVGKPPEQRYLIPDLEWVPFAMSYDHGWGTATTGSHVAASVADHFSKDDIPVLSMDTRYHGYGPRDFVGSWEKFIEWKIGIENLLIHPNVRLFAAGHSGGGVIADMLMRLSDHPVLGPKIKERYSGLFPLAGVPDIKVGGTLEEKLQAFEGLFDLTPEELALMSPFDAELGDSLLRTGKLSAIVMLSVEFLTGLVNWELPEHRGKDWLPAFYVWGLGDFLLARGGLDAVNRYINPLENTQLFLIPPRVTFDSKGEPEVIGHMISDHSAPDSLSNMPEIIVKMLDFMYKVTGTEREERTQQLSGHINAVNREQGIRDTIVNVLRQYFQNLAFREFIKEHFFVELKKTDRFLSQFLFGVQLKSFLNSFENQRKKSGSVIPTTELRDSLIKLVTNLFDGIQEKEINIDYISEEPLYQEMLELKSNLEGDGFVGLSNIRIKNLTDQIVNYQKKMEGINRATFVPPDDRGEIQSIVDEMDRLRLEIKKLEEVKPQIRKELADQEKNRRDLTVKIDSLLQAQGMLSTFVSNANNIKLRWDKVVSTVVGFIEQGLKLNYEDKIKIELSYNLQRLIGVISEFAILKKSLILEETTEEKLNGGISYIEDFLRTIQLWKTNLDEWQRLSLARSNPETHKLTQSDYKRIIKSLNSLGVQFQWLEAKSLNIHILPEEQWRELEESVDLKLRERMQEKLYEDSSLKYGTEVFSGKLDEIINQVVSAELSNREHLPEVVQLQKDKVNSLFKDVKTADNQLRALITQYQVEHHTQVQNGESTERDYYKNMPESLQESIHSFNKIWETFHQADLKLNELVYASVRSGDFGKKTQELLFGIETNNKIEQLESKERANDLALYNARQHLQELREKYFNEFFPNMMILKKIKYSELFDLPLTTWLDFNSQEGTNVYTQLQALISEWKMIYGERKQESSRTELY